MGTRLIPALGVRFQPTPRGGNSVVQWVLSHCCSHKAGLASDAWKDSETEVYLFDAEIFGAEFNNIG